MNTTEIFLMNPHTGSVQSEQDWKDEGYTIDNSELIEVKIVNGLWVEV